MIARIAYPFLLLAAFGFVELLVIHVATLFGMTSLFEQSMRFIVPGLFVVWLPTVLIMSRLTRDFKQKDIWRAALRGCPEWMRKVQWAVVGYAWIGFFALPFIYGGGMALPVNKARSMTAALLIFYSIATTVLYSATQSERFDASRLCENGHRLSAMAKYCEECGAPVRTSPPGVRQSGVIDLTGR